jgi:predicted enzyme related to lactoylglutathione lyase
VDNPVVHFEITGPDGPHLRGFYKELFGWQLRQVPMPGYDDYGFLPAPDGNAIGGGVGTVEGQGNA